MRKHRLKGLITLGVAAAALSCGVAHASEGGASFYLLGSSGPEAAIMPPLPGVFFSNTAYVYHGEAGAGRDFQVGGNIVAGLKATIAADFPTMLWVPSTNFLGGTVAVGAIIPAGEPWVDVSAVLTGPGGNTISVHRSDTAFVFGDPAGVGMLGWKWGKTYLQFSDLLNVPIGDYRYGDLANLAFHRWANDSSAALTWHDDKSGWDLSAKSGFTFNGENPATQYRTGTEWHIEASVQKRLSPAWALGVQAYHFDQVTGDSGPGAKLGSFEGQVTGVGGNIAYNFKLGTRPATLMLHGASEFDAVNRLQGSAVWLDFSIPIDLKLPPGAK